jgi:hypothetical protein
MIRIAIVALAALVFALPGHAQVAGGAPIGQGLLKSWVGTVCKGNMRITFTFTALKGDRLAGTYLDSESLGMRFDPEGPSPIRASVSGDTVTIQIQSKQTFVLNYAGGALAGEYIRAPDHWTPPSQNCPRREPVRFN